MYSPDRHTRLAKEVSQSKKGHRSRPGIAFHKNENEPVNARSGLSGHAAGGRETAWKADSPITQDRPMPASGGFGHDFADAQSPEDFLVQPSADARIRQEVDTFLLSLPLGTSARDAAIEDKVAERLLSLHTDIAAMQAKVHEWAETAMDLRDVVTGQRDEIEQLQKCQAVSAGPGEEFSSLPDDVIFEHSYAAQQQVTTDLQRLMLSLQEDQHHPAYDLVLARLSTTQRQLGALRVAHDLALRHQKELHQRELEGLHSDLRGLEASAERRDEVVHQGYEDQERLHAATELDMQQTLRAVSHLRSQLQEADSAKMKLAATLAEERARSASLDRKLHERACEVVQLRQRAEELQQYRTASSGWQQQKVQLAVAADEQQSQAADSPAVRLSSCDQVRQAEEEGRVADEASPPLRGAASCADSEHMATRVSAEAWTNALAAQVDELQTRSQKLERDHKKAQEAATTANALNGRLREAEDWHQAQLAAVRQTFRLEKTELQAALSDTQRQIEATRQAAAIDREALTEQVASLEEQLTLQHELEDAYAQDLQAASAKLDAQFRERQAAEASLWATLSLLRGIRTSLESGQHSGGAAAEGDLRAAVEQVRVLATELHDVKAVAAAECNRLRRVAEDAEQQRNVVQADRESAVAAVLAQHTHEVVALQSRSDVSIAELHARHQAECAALQQANESLRDKLTETEAAWKAKEEEIHGQHQQHVRAAYEAGAQDMQTNAPDFAALQRETLSLRQELEAAKLSAADEASNACAMNQALQQQLRLLDADRTAMANELMLTRNELARRPSAEAVQVHFVTALGKLQAEHSAQLEQLQAQKPDHRDEASQTNFPTRPQPRSQPPPQTGSSASTFAAPKVQAATSHCSSAHSHRLESTSRAASRDGQQAASRTGTPDHAVTSVPPSAFAAASVQARLPSQDSSERRPADSSATSRGASADTSAQGSSSRMRAREFGDVSSHPQPRDLHVRLQQQAEQHAAELASLQEAFTARSAAMHEDLEAKLEAIESLEPALCTAEAELAETKDALDKSQNALMDCQEMLEELQAFGEKQEAELMALREELHEGESARERAEEQLSAAREAAEQSSRRIDTLLQQVAALEEQRPAQQARANALQQERDCMKSELAASRSQLGQLECASGDSLAGELQQAQQDRAAADTRLAAIAQAMQQSQEEYASRMDRLASQIGDEARRRAQAEAKALAYYQAHTHAQARSQEQSETLLRKIFEQEQAIKQLLSHHPDYTPDARASMLTALGDASPNKPTPLIGTPQPNALDFGQENTPAQASIRGSTSPQSGHPSSELPGLAELDNPSKPAFQHLHFNPVFGDRSPSRLKRLCLHAHRAAHESGSRSLEASLGSIAGEFLGSELLQEQPGGPPSPPGSLRATSPNRWVKVGDKKGSPQWMTIDEAEKA